MGLIVMKKSVLMRENETEQRRKGAITSISRDDLIARANELGEGFEIPEELLDSIAGGMYEEDKKPALRLLATFYKAAGLSLDEAIARERDNWHRPQDELDFIRGIWDSIK